MPIDFRDAFVAKISADGSRQDRVLQVPRRAGTGAKKKMIAAGLPLYNNLMQFTLFGLLAALSLSAADVNTFSIVAYDPATGDCGVTVASKYFSVGAVVP